MQYVFFDEKKISYEHQEIKREPTGFFSKRKIILCTSGNKFIATFIRFITCNS